MAGQFALWCERFVAIRAGSESGPETDIRAHGKPVSTGTEPGLDGYGLRGRV